MGKKKPAKKTAAQKPNRGRPKEGGKKIVPDDYERMARLFGTGWSLGMIAREYGVARNAITYHFNNYIFPMVSASCTHSVEAELTKIDTIEQVAWECFFSSNPAEVRELVKDQIERLRKEPKEVREKVTKLIERTVTQVKKPHDKAWIDIILDCIDRRCRLRGHYAAVKVRVEAEEFRVAGMSPAESMRALHDRIEKKAVELRHHEAKLAKAGVSFTQMVAPQDN